MKNITSPKTANYSRSCAIPLLMILLGGCAVGPDYSRPETPKIGGYTRADISSQHQEFTNGDGPNVNNGELGSIWWKEYDSKIIDELVDKALKNNLTIEGASFALKQAQELTKAQFAEFFPELSANYSGSRQLQSGTIAPNLNSGAPLYSLHTAQLNVGFTPDVFGLNRRSVEAANAQEEFQRFQLDALKQTVISNVATEVIQIAALNDQIRATNAIIASNRKSLSIIQSQLDLGAASGIDLATQESALEQSIATLAPLEKQLEQTKDALAILVGEPPSELNLEVISLNEIKVPHDLPISVPSTLLQRRPDIRAAEEQVHLASAQVGVAVANRFPLFSIFGAKGGSAVNFNQMFNNGNTFWAISGSVTQPIFDFGGLMHRQRAAEAGLEQAKAQYRQAVLVAFQNVSDSLYAVGFDYKQKIASELAEKSAKKLFVITKRQLEFGSVNALALNNAEQTYLQAEISHIQADANVLTDSAALFYSLGFPLE